MPLYLTYDLHCIYDKSLIYLYYVQALFVYKYVMSYMYNMYKYPWQIGQGKASVKITTL